MSELQLVIPMSGVGQRFVDAGYSPLKPLIKVAGETIISHVMKMYSEIEDPVYIISSVSTQKDLLRKELLDLRPKCKIVEISPHKLGPSFAVWEARDQIDQGRKTVVNYCDFSGIWNLNEMIKSLDEADGAILTYTGFHPHMLRNTKYAYVLEDAEGKVTSIQEKGSFTDSPMLEKASAGTYGFRTGRVMLDAIENQIKEDISVNNEFYTSLTYLPLLKKGGFVKTVNMDRFFQWGTPEDLEDWNYWHKSIKRLHNEKNEPEKVEGAVVILAAGSGFRIQSPELPPKPLIEIVGKELWEYSGECGAKAQECIVVTRDSLVPEKNNLGIPILMLSELTAGQAISAKHGLNQLNTNNSPVSVLSCDNVVYGTEVNEAHELAKTWDLIVWSAENYPYATESPAQFSWIGCSQEESIQVFLKKAPPTFTKFSVIIGNFTFKSRALALELIEELEKRDIRINGEFYLDSVISVAIEKGLKVTTSKVTDFFAIGTPDEYRTYKYWLEVISEYPFKD